MATTEEGLNRISLRVPEEMFAKLKVKAAQEQVTLQDVGIALWEQWLTGKQEVPAKDDPVVQDFRDFLASSATSERKKALKVNVEVFLENELRRSKKRASA